MPAIMSQNVRKMEKMLHNAAKKIDWVYLLSVRKEEKLEIKNFQYSIIYILFNFINVF